MCYVMFYIGNFIEDFIARMSAYLRLLSTPSILVHVVSIIYINQCMFLKVLKKIKMYKSGNTGYENKKNKM